MGRFAKKTRQDAKEIKIRYYLLISAKNPLKSKNMQYAEKQISKIEEILNQLKIKNNHQGLTNEDFLSATNEIQTIKNETPKKT